MVNILQYTMHTIYSRNNIGKKCEGNCGLWVLNEIIKRMSPENLKKIMGAYLADNSQTAPTIFFEFSGYTKSLVNQISC